MGKKIPVEPWRGRRCSWKQLTISREFFVPCQWTKLLESEVDDVGRTTAAQVAHLSATIRGGH